MNRRSPTLLFALGALACFGFTASLATAKDRKQASDGRPFVEETRITAPARVGEFAFVASKYDAKHKFAGAQFRYEHPEYRQIRIDLFVYPIGDMPSGKAIETGMKAFRESFGPGIESGYFNDFKIVGSEAFEIVPPLHAPAQVATGPVPVQQEQAPGGATKAPAKLTSDQLETLLGVTPLQGERMTLYYRIQDQDTKELIPMRSLGYLFYKDMYFFKGRISAAQSQIDEATFLAMSDRAMRELVPEIHAFNVGSCAQITINVNVDAPQGAQAEGLVRAMGEALTKKASMNCHGDLDGPAFKKVAVGAEIITIKYDAKEWGDR